MKITQQIYCLLFGVLISSLTYANIMVYPMSLTINDVNLDKNQFKVYSKSDKVQHLNIYVKQVLNPATAQEKEAPIFILNETAIIASPQKIILPPGAEHTIRLRALSSPSKESLYRVYVEPVATNSDEDQLITKERASEGINLTRVVLVYSKPQIPEVKLSVDTQNGLIQNKGNIHIWIKDITACISTECSTCKKIIIERSVFPGLSLQIPEAIIKMKSIVIDYRTQDSDLISQHWYF